MSEGNGGHRSRLAALKRQIGEGCTADFARLQRRWRELARHSDPAALARLEADAAASLARRAARAAGVPAITLEDLPIRGHAEAILDALAKHPVIVVAGETGSGKTTQLPKLCLAAGRGAAGMIGCTQPRRLAARSMARRVAAELGSELGDKVGFEVRFAAATSDATLVKFMTDGILLAELQRDRWLRAYDTLIIDEAHERSLNIDFLLGWLAQLVRRRRDLKVIITSATIDTGRFAAHFGGAPVIEVEGRAWPVEVRWRPLADTRGATEGMRAGSAEHVALALEEITAEDPRGDVLVFLPGEREIRDAHRVLARRGFRDTEVLPLYARLPAREQDRVFQPGRARRVVLATNVAETSLTVPRIRCVIDTGEARVQRYSRRRQLEQLRIEPVSQAAADQRKGRCGRVGPGICIRLYAEADYLARPRDTEPELLRSSLANVILRMLDIGLGDVAAFPFLDPPPPAAIADGYRRLQELGALDAARRLTPTGRAMAQWPIDASLARMLLAARERGALESVLAIVAFLGVQDPQERPPDAREAADAAHRLFADQRSDFMGVLRLWQAWREAHAALAQRALRAWCEEHFLSFPRMREWRELHRQLQLHPQVARSAHRTAGKPEPPTGPARATARRHREADGDALLYEAIHRSLLAGLPTRVALRDEEGAFRGTRGERFRVFPGSALTKAPPRWLLAAQVLDLGPQVWAMLCARVEPAWIEAAAAHLVRRSWSGAHWVRRRGRVEARERVSLYGLVLVEARTVAWQAQDPAAAHAIFLEQALAECAIDTRAEFVATNRAVLAAAREREAKARRHGLLRDAAGRAAFFAGKLPESIASTAALEKWLRRATREERAALHWTLEDLLEPGGGIASADFPPVLEIAGQELALVYRFLPGDLVDGVSLRLPLVLLNAVPAAACEWLVPGYLEEKVVALIRGLPRKLRRNFVPAPDFARAFREAEAPRDEPLASVLAVFLARVTGVAVEAGAFAELELPPHLRLRFELLDASGAQLAAGRDLAALRDEWSDQARRAFSRRADAQLPSAPASSWSFGELPERLRSAGGLDAWVALVDLGGSVAARAFETQEEAARLHPLGVTRLLRLALAGAMKTARRQLPLAADVALRALPLAAAGDLREDVVAGAFSDLLADAQLEVRDPRAFDQLRDELASRLFAAATRRLQPVVAIIAAHAELRPWLEPPLLGFARASYDDLGEQLSALLPPAFAATWPLPQLEEIPRYIKGMRMRAERLRLDPARDRQRLLQLLPWWQAWQRLHALAAGDDEVQALHWLIEEYRISLFAQEVGTAGKVSPRRLARQLAAAQAAVQ